jgi:hypothetical protein
MNGEQELDAITAFEVALSKLEAEFFKLERTNAEGQPTSVGVHVLRNWETRLRTIANGWAVRLRHLEYPPSAYQDGLPGRPE